MRRTEFEGTCGKETHEPPEDGARENRKATAPQCAAAPHGEGASATGKRPGTYVEGSSESHS